MKNLFTGVVYDFLINKSINNRGDWKGNAGIIDGRTAFDLENSKKAVSIIIDILKEINPKRILETGTNYGSFSYVLYETLDNFTLHTCDFLEGIKDNSAECIKFINEYYKKENIKFYNKDTIEFLMDLKHENQSFDLAWIDSAHDYQTLLNELNVCAQMKIPYLMVDDFWVLNNLQESVFDFLKKNKEYRFYYFSNVRESIGSIVLLKRVE